LLPSVRGCEWGSNPLGGSLYSLLNKPIQRWTGARAGEVSEAAAVKARWLGNFCPRQPVHRALKRQQQPRPLSAAPGSSALNRPGPAREFKSEARAHPASSCPARLLKTTCPSQGLRPSPASGNGPPVRIINPAPGRPAISTLPHRCDGFYGHQPAGPAREFKLQARVHRCHPGPARLLKVTLSARVLRPAPGDGPFSQVHRPRTGPACNHCSPLRRVLRSSTGRPRSEARLTSSGSSGPPWVRPACSSDSGWSGFHGPASGDGPASTSRQVH
jgi:hypothetical protein